MITSNVVDSLTEPGQLLVFCDDTDISGSPQEWLAPNLRILCAVVMTSECYALASAEMKKKLKNLGQTEFHATEIVNPKAAAPWKRVPVEERRKALQFLGDLLAKSIAKLYYAHISKGQYEQLKGVAEKYGSVSVGHKAGLKRVFLLCLFERLEHLGSAGAKKVVILDQDKPHVAPVVENWPGGEFLCGGGPIAADSASIPGLQLADTAAFSIGRYLRKREEIAADRGNHFDIIALETIVGLEGRCECILN
jgi:hypothetical protein